MNSMLLVNMDCCDDLPERLPNTSDFSRNSSISKELAGGLDYYLSSCLIKRLSLIPAMSGPNIMVDPKHF